MIRVFYFFLILGGERGQGAREWLHATISLPVTGDRGKDMGMDVWQLQQACHQPPDRTHPPQERGRQGLPTMSLVSRLCPASPLFPVPAHGQGPQQGNDTRFAPCFTINAKTFVFSCRGTQHSGLCCSRWPSGLPHLWKGAEQGRLPDGRTSQGQTHFPSHALGWGSVTCLGSVIQWSSVFWRSCIQWFQSSAHEWLHSWRRFMEVKLLAVYYMLPVSNFTSFIVGIICLSWLIYIFIP